MNSTVHAPGASRRIHASRLTLTVVGFVLICLGCPVFAQHPGGGGPPGGGRGGGAQQAGGSFGRPDGFPGPGHGDNGGSPSSTMRPGLQLGPPGRWWNDDRFAKDLGLNRDQQHRMDDIFKANKGQLVTLFRGLRHEESQLDRVSRTKVLDEAQIDAQIDKVVQARGDLEKANAHMLLEIRKQMTPEQTAKLDENRPGPPPNEN